MDWLKLEIPNKQNAIIPWYYTCKRNYRVHGIVWCCTFFYDIYGPLANCCVVHLVILNSILYPIRPR